MIKATFVQDPGKINSLTQALSILHQINFFGVLLEIGAAKTPSGARITTDSVHAYALKSAMHEGYIEALNDIYYFLERHTGEKATPAKIDYGAPEALLASGDITQREYEEMYGRPASS